MGNEKLSREDLDLVRINVRRLSADYFHMASATELAAGLSWYETARGICWQIVADHEDCCRFTFDEVRGAMAVLSQQNRWHQNVADTVQAASENHVKTWSKSSYGQMYMTPITKSWDILYDHKLERVSGPKVTEFYRSIDLVDDAVAIDTWIFRAFGFYAIGWSLSWAGLYEAIADGVRAAAADLDLTSFELQAIIWVVIRGDWE